MVRNIREKKFRGKNFSSKQATDENILTPSRILVTCTYLHVRTSNEVFFHNLCGTD